MDEASKDNALTKTFHFLKGKKFRVEQYLPRGECLKIKQSKQIRPLAEQSFQMGI